MKTELVWQLGFSDNYESFPTEYFSATVPGAVQLDYAKAYSLPNHNAELNFKKYAWMEDKFWFYKTEYDATNLKGNKLYFVSEGIDYKFDILINGVCR